MDMIACVNRQEKIPVYLLCDALNVPRATYYRHHNNGKRISLTVKVPKNALSLAEKQHVLDTLHSERFVDKTPYEVFNALMDSDEYYCSVRTMYCLLEARGETQDR